MYLSDLLYEQPTDFSIVQSDCSDFIHESNYHLVYRALPRSYNDIHRVKVRQQKHTDVVTRVFNEAFRETPNIRQRSIISQSTPPIPTINTEPYYIFPVNGYKYMYSKEVKDSSADYQQLIHTMFEHLSSEEAAAKILSDVVKYSYNTTNLLEGIRTGAEIIFYNIPFYYAIKCAAYPNTKTLISYL